MNDVLNIIQGVIRWTVPLAALAIIFLAWKRYPAAGAKLAIAGFALMSISPLVRQLLNLFGDPRRSDFSRDIAIILYAGTTFSVLGMIVIVFALRRLITAAEAKETAESTNGDEIWTP